MSAFEGAIQAVSVWRATRLTAGPNPRFRSGTSSLTQGNSSRTRSGEPSLEPLSTTQTSARPASTSACIERRQAARSARVFHETTAMAT